MVISISNKKNYFSELKTTNQEILKKYSVLIKEYLELFQSNVEFSNSFYLNNIFTKGLTAINHIFNIILLYTKNIDLTFIYCQKSIFYYIEFIDQISEDANSFLQLNSQDAVLFVYKKTIYEIDNDHIKNYVLTNDKDKEKMNTIKEVTVIIEKLFGYYIENNVKIVEIELYINKILKRLINSKVSYSFLINTINILDNLIFEKTSMPKINYFMLCVLKHTEYNIKSVLKKINSSEFTNKKNNLSHIKFSLWLIE